MKEKDFIRLFYTNKNNGKIELISRKKETSQHHLEIHFDQYYN